MHLTCFKGDFLFGGKDYKSGHILFIRVEIPNDSGKVEIFLFSLVLIS